MAVWSQVSTVTDVTNHEQISQTTRTFAFDRRTAQLVDCCGASVNGDKSVHQTGMLGYVFPFGTQKQTYQVYDPTLKRTAPFTYTGTGTVNGIPVYVFTQDVAPTQVATLPIPGALLGLKAAVVTMGEFDQQHQVYSVDPETGALVNVEEHQIVTLRDPATRAIAKVVYDADLTVTPQTLKTVTALDSSGRNTLHAADDHLADHLRRSRRGLAGRRDLPGGPRAPARRTERGWDPGQRSSSRVASSR